MVVKLTHLVSSTKPNRAAKCGRSPYYRYRAMGRYPLSNSSSMSESNFAQNAVRDVFPPGRCRGEKQFQRTRCHRSLGWILCETKTLVFLGDYFANDVTRWFLSRRRFQVTPKLECGH